MNFKSLNFKIYLGSVYLIILFASIYFIWLNFDISDFTSYNLIRENREIILGYKEKNIFFMTVVFVIITIALNSSPTSQ